jgi:hypothetical protein
MGLFNRKPKVKQIYGGAWGHLVADHKITVDQLAAEYRCVDKPGLIDGGYPVTLLRIFRLADLEKKGVTVTGWETFDQHPDLIMFEGHLTADNVAHLEQKDQ